MERSIILQVQYHYVLSYTTLARNMESVQGNKRAFKTIWRAFNYYGERLIILFATDDIIQDKYYW